MGSKQFIDELDIHALRTVCAELDLPAYRAKQIYDAIARGAARFDDITTLSKPLRERLSERFAFACPQIADTQTSVDGTVKYLMQLHDGQCVETVLMRYKHGLSICLSTQAGCRMNCAFCASAKSGYVRNLTVGEIVGQYTAAASAYGESPRHIVLMGVGEPLDNYDNTVAFLRRISDPDGIGLSPRHISVSTCGVVPRIDDLSREGLPVTLSLSLHAPDDVLRKQLMPIARKYSVRDTMDACDRYFERTGRRVSIEYIMLRGVNDTDAHAAALVGLLRNKGYHVNLIPANHVGDMGYAASDSNTCRRFAESLNKRGVNATVRRSLGGDIAAACGELRRKQQQGFS